MGQEDIVRVDKPLSSKQITKLADKDGWITVLVPIDLSDLIDNNLEGFLDFLDERIGCVLMQQEYSIHSVISPSTFLMKVEADITALYNM